MVGCRCGTSPRMEDGGGAGLQVQAAPGWRTGQRWAGGRGSTGLEDGGHRTADRESICDGDLGEEGGFIGVGLGAVWRFNRWLAGSRNRSGGGLTCAFRPLHTVVEARCSDA
jgi:hypothetical protein